MKILISLIIGLLFVLSLYGQGEVFNNTYTGDAYLWGRTIIQTDDGNFIIVGSGSPVPNTASIFIKNISGSGEFIWEKAYGGEGEYYFNSLSGSTIQTSDGGFITVGTYQFFDPNINSDALLVRFNSEGDTLWTKRYGGPNFSVGYAVEQTSDSGFILVGFDREPNQSDDALIIKTDSLGNQEWKTTYGNNLLDRGFSVLVDQDGNYIVGLGKDLDLDIQGGQYKSQAIKLNGTGNIIWWKTLGLGCGASVYPAEGGGYYLQACRDTFIENVFTENVSYVRKMNNDFEPIWETSFVNSFGISAWNSRSISNERIIVSGVAKLDGDNLYGWLAKLDTNGNIIMESTYYTNPNFNNYFTDAIATSDGGFVATGSARTEGLTQAMWLVKVDSMGCLVPGCDSTITSVVTPQFNPPELTIFPNPARETITIQSTTLYPLEGNVRIYNSLGQLVDIFQMTSETTELDISKYPSGLYYVEISDRYSTFARGKFIKAG